MITYEKVKTRVLKEVDLEDEDFVRPEEMLAWCNQAIDNAEALVLGLYEDYFLTMAPISLVASQSEYSLPVGIWAQKIRHFQYDNGSLKYEVRKIKQLKEVLEVESFSRFRYLITNDSVNGLRLKLYPTPTETGEILTLWYLRNAKAVALDADLIDIPEAEAYIVQYMKDEVIKKERNTPDAPPSAALKEQETILMESLATRIPDEDNTIPIDTSFYGEHV